MEPSHGYISIETMNLESHSEMSLKFSSHTRLDEAVSLQSFSCAIKISSSLPGTEHKSVPLHGLNCLEDYKSCLGKGEAI